MGDSGEGWQKVRRRFKRNSDKRKMSHRKGGYQSMGTGICYGGRFCAEYHAPDVSHMGDGAAEGVMDRCMGSGTVVPDTEKLHGVNNRGDDIFYLGLRLPKVVSQPRINTLVEDVKRLTYLWIKNRATKEMVNWEDWRSFNFYYG
ncbi:hypothetical protein R6Q57_012932 [Mikania cordata]